MKYYIVAVKRADGDWRIFGDSLGETFLSKHFFEKKEAAKILAETHKEMTSAECLVIEVDTEELSE